MAEKKLPIGVGKKIVEALKKQNEISEQVNGEVLAGEDAAIAENNELISSEDLNSFDEEQNVSDEVNDFDLNEIEDGVQDILNETPVFDNSQVSDFNQTTEFEPQPVSYEQNAVFEPSATNFETNVQFQNVSQNNFTQYTQQMQETQLSPNYGERTMTMEQEHKTYTMPANVAVLKKLISQLPSGVTKQVGAQIIRQTMEALGISMNSLLTEAQRYQDDLNNSIRDCMTTVNEYKQNIMTLEKQVVDYQKQAKAFNDLISLFILTDK